MTHHALRRAAILIASLDTRSADALLDEMSPEQAARVRSAVMDLGEIHPSEQQQVIAQFVQQGPRASAGADPGVEVDPELARKFAQPPATPPDHATATGEALPTRPFAFLDAVEAEEVARVLSGEHPQTTAIILAHLEPARAAEVLCHLTDTRQREALMRIARLSTPHPDIIRDLEQEMHARLHQGEREEVAAAGLASVEAILRHASPHQRQGWVTELSHHDRVLVRQLRVSASASHVEPTSTAASAADSATNTGRRGTSDREFPPRAAGARHDAGAARGKTSVVFSELESLDNAAWAMILRRSSPNTTLLALAGASHDFVRKILRQLPGREAAQLDRKIQHIGPLRLDDVQRAQQQLAETAQQLIDEGQIVIPGQPRFAVAA